jgi:hypothetical protein
VDRGAVAWVRTASDAPCGATCDADGPEIRKIVANTPAGTAARTATDRISTLRHFISPNIRREA